ncbi:ATP-dependent DNA helicase Q-like 4B [Acorus gramineus]|uniref:ATP-dependent DNA helicase n=1 Tax=Acorus gramineus TaxID=55184 RepID=A0AAV9AMY9_ACOGR|nr:ATP-dependent DNA helicase Q-like 4B [Acorus gramineus]
MESTLKRYFGYSQFRPYQKEIIEMVLDGRDCLAVMATGSGKSLCYQIPPLVKKKTAVVISPLLSLMQDQVMSLNQRGIKADYLGSTQKDSTVQCNAESGRFDILYMTPEKACSISPRFWSNLSKAGICLLAVDEAHCISEWGHDFRKEYKQLDALREHLVDVPFIGLTATATEKVRQDILRSLKMTDPYIAVGSFDRNNLFYGVKSFARGMAFVDELVNEISKNVATSGSTIIYCTTVKDAEQIFKSLESAGIRAGLYHGQMGSKAREESHRSFIRDDLHVMVATIAFGMGIDKPNIRCVIHYGCPKSLESYYQGSGRCGRDGLASICWLYYTRSDFAKADFYCAEADTVKQRQAIMESYMAAQRYCLLTTCRRRFLLEYFGEKLTFTKCGNCDNCTSSKMERDMSREALLLLTCIRSCGGHWGLNMPIDILRGSRSKRIVDNNFDKLPSHGIGKDYPPNWWKALAEQLIAHGTHKDLYIIIFAFFSLSPTGQQFLHSSITVDQPQLILTVTNEMVDEEEHRFEQGNAKGDLQNLASLGFEGFSEAEVKLYHMLLEMRMNLAKNTGTAPYAICGDQTIKKITKIRPSTKVRLANIDGVNQHLVANYGDHIIQTINDMVQELKLSRDGVATVQTAITKRVMPNSHKGLSSAKFDAWRLWQNNGLSIQEISNFPGRSAPIKEGTVILYLIDAAREGCEISWPRLCKDIGLTQEICSKIEAAISKVGSRERLKPIKEELPEDVSYVHIRAFLTMQDLGISTKDNLDPQPSNPGESHQIQIHYHISMKLLMFRNVFCRTVHVSDKYQSALPSTNSMQQ